MGKYCVVEYNDCFVICRGSSLTWEEANMKVLTIMQEDSHAVNDGLLQNVALYSLEANDPGLCVSYNVEGRKHSLYILDDPGKDV